MAFLEEDENKVGIPGIGPQGAFIGTGAPSPGPSTTAPIGSGSFTNLQQYIEANRPKAQELGQKIAGGISQEAEQLRGEVAGQRETTLGAGSQISQEQQRIEQAQPFVTQAIEQAGTGPTDTERFSRILGGQGGVEAGPDLSQERQQAQALQERSKELSTAGGRFSELGRLVGGKSATYSAGQRALDELMLTGAPNRAQQIKQARAATAGLGEQVGTLGTDVTARLAEQQAARGELAGTAAEQLEAARTGLTETTAEQLAAAKATGAEDYQRILASLQSGQLSAEDLQTLGLTEGQQSYNISPEDFLTQAGDPTLTGVSTPEQVARYQMLQQLSGQTGPGIYGGIDPTTAGQYGGGYAFDQPAFAGAAQEAGAEYRAKTEPLLQTLQQFAGARTVPKEFNQALANVQQNPDDIGAQQQLYVTGQTALTKLQNEGPQVGPFGDVLNAEQHNQQVSALTQFLDTYKQYTPGQQIGVTPADIETGGAFGVS